MADNIIKTGDDLLNYVKKTTFHLNPTLYKALRVKLISEGKTVTAWIREKILEEVTAGIPADTELELEPTEAEVFGTENKE